MALVCILCVGNGENMGYAPDDLAIFDDFFDFFKH